MNLILEIPNKNYTIVNGPIDYHTLCNITDGNYTYEYVKQNFSHLEIIQYQLLFSKSKYILLIESNFGNDSYMKSLWISNLQETINHNSNHIFICSNCLPGAKIFARNLYPFL